MLTLPCSKEHSSLNYEWFLPLTHPFLNSSSHRPTTSQNTVPSMHLGNNMPSWAPPPLSTAPTPERSQPSKGTIPQSQAASPVPTSVTRGGTRVTSTYQLTKPVYRWLSFCMWLVSSLRIQETQWMSIASESIFTWSLHFDQTQFEMEQKSYSKALFLNVVLL